MDALEVHFHGIQPPLGMAGNLDIAVPLPAGYGEKKQKDGEKRFFHLTDGYGKIVAQN